MHEITHSSSTQILLIFDSYIYTCSLLLDEYRATVLYTQLTQQQDENISQQKIAGVSIYDELSLWLLVHSSNNLLKISNLTQSPGEMLT